MNITKKTTAGELIDMVDGIMGSFAISKLHDELIENFISNGIAEEKLEDGLTNYNIVEEFIQDSQAKTDDAKDLKSQLMLQIAENDRKIELENFSENFIDLFTKYNYGDYMQKVYLARHRFDSFRSEYLFQKFLGQSKGTLNQGNAIAEECFIASIDINLKMASDIGGNVRMVYEDLHGVRQSILTTLMEEAYMDEDGNIIFRPEGYWVGHNCFDGFRIHYYWDVEDEEWVPVPIHLIQGLVMEEVSSQNEFFDDDEDEFDYGGGDIFG